MNKANRDWIGKGANSIYSPLGASNHVEEERAWLDYYATDPEAIDDLFKLHQFDKTIWENACGQGHLSERMKKHGKGVYSTDIEDRGYGDDFFDFLESDIEWEGDIITNPPYSYAQEWVEHSISSLKEGKQLALFLKITFLEGIRRRKMFDEYPPEYIYVFSRRKKCALNGNEDSFKEGSAACYAWFIWRKGFEREPTIRWI